MRVIQPGVDPTRIELVAQEITPRQLIDLRNIEGANKIKVVASSAH